jgi:hypothetical protein
MTIQNEPRVQGAAEPGAPVHRAFLGPDPTPEEIDEFVAALLADQPRDEPTDAPEADEVPAAPEGHAVR